MLTEVVLQAGRLKGRLEGREDQPAAAAGEPGEEASGLEGPAEPVT